MSIFFRTVTQPRLNRIQVDVLPKLAVLLPVPNAPIIEAGLPNLATVAQLFPGAIREPTLDELHCSLDRVGWSKEQMNMVWHDHKLMQQVFPLVSIAEEHV